jgi:hypothetical protein
MSQIVPAMTDADIGVWRICDEVTVLLSLVQVGLDEHDLVTAGMHCLADAAVVGGGAVPVG